MKIFNLLHIICYQCLIYFFFSDSSKGNNSYLWRICCSWKADIYIILQIRSYIIYTYEYRPIVYNLENKLNCQVFSLSYFITLEQILKKIFQLDKNKFKISKANTTSWPSKLKCNSLSIFKSCFVFIPVLRFLIIEYFVLFNKVCGVMKFFKFLFYPCPCCNVPVVEIVLQSNNYKS